MAWRKIIVLGLVSAAAFIGCTVTTDDDPDDDGGGSGGSSSGGKATGGSGSGGKSTGGSSSGGTSSGGSKATGGSDGDSGPVCSGGNNACLTCVQTKCCDEWLACGEDVACSSKSEAQPGELICIQNCLIDQVGDAAVVDLQECAGRCAEDSSGVSTATSELIACMRALEDGDGGVQLQACSLPCFGTEL